jgi:hypothetical protein
MKDKLLVQSFEKMGARVVVKEPFRSRFLRPNLNSPFRFDVRRDKKGEYFLLSKSEGDKTELVVLDVQPEDRHLLLLTREGKKKARFLAGHDERHWFVAAIPEKTPVSTVRAAKSALKPAPVREASGVIRQGEWFFIPRPKAKIDEKWVLHNEPITRGQGSKPHRCQDLCRTGGVTVYVNSSYPNGLPEAEYAKLDAKTKKSGWRVMRRDARVFVRGRIRHSDHKTIVLPGWHEVLMNTENQSLAMQHVAFLD